jgi:endonuclease/exonuclease/phosphatase family metal-dependent hydrolase
MRFKSAVSGVLVWCVCLTAARAINVGTYNIRYDTPQDHVDGNSWQRRAPVVANLIRFHNFDVLATEEGLPHQMADLTRLLPEYGCSSHGRDDGKLAGEHIGIFYKSAKYELVDSGFFWLSEHPDQPGIGWDAALPRICGWARLKIKSSQKTFCYFGLHMDHRGVEARQQAVALILRKIGEIAGSDPVVLTGDFNTDQHSEPYKLVVASPGFSDACADAENPFALNGTFNNFDPSNYTDSRIDHVFVSKNLKVVRYGILTDTYRTPNLSPAPATTTANAPEEVKLQAYQIRLPSDHFPVLVELADW